VANGAGLQASALITDMSEPLASAAGNAVEVVNAVDFLVGKHRDSRLAEVTLALGAEALVLAGLATDLPAAAQRVKQALDSGEGAEVFARMVAALGGPPDLLSRTTSHLPAAPVVRAVYPARPGVVAGVTARDIGIAVVELGGGRRKADDRIDPSVGFTELAAAGTAVGPDVPLAMVHARTAADADRATEALRGAYAIGTAAPLDVPLIYERVGGRPGP
jgi:thymidine phosphorylase